MRISFLVSLCVFALFLACIQERPYSKADKTSPVSDRLAEMVTADQRLRSDDTLDYGIVAETDRLHREVVFELLAEGAITEATDLHRAALILQHADPSSCRECYFLAYQLAKRAVELGLDNARGMVAGCLDRYLVFSGKPQKYGTQYNQDSVGIWYLFPIDTLTSDSQRVVWNVPPLDSLKIEIDLLNGH